MTDVFDTKKRSELMSKIRSKDTMPELIVRRYLHAKGYRYRLNDKRLIGKPDIKLTKYKTIILVNGCFWHGHENCKIFKMPKSRQHYWIPKIEMNIKRAEENITQLENLGWHVIVVWECELKK